MSEKYNASFFFYNKIYIKQLYMYTFKDFTGDTYINYTLKMLFKISEKTSIFTRN